MVFFQIGEDFLFGNSDDKIPFDRSLTVLMLVYKVN